LHIQLSCPLNLNAYILPLINYAKFDDSVHPLTGQCNPLNQPKSAIQITQPTGQCNPLNQPKSAIQITSRQAQHNLLHQPKSAIQINQPTGA
jgi:hypothetical protein